MLKILLKEYIFNIAHLGYAQDGGLYFPESIPKLDKIEIEKMANLTYPELVKQIMPLFIDESEIPVKDLHLLIMPVLKLLTLPLKPWMGNICVRKLYLYPISWPLPI